MVLIGLWYNGITCLPAGRRMHGGRAGTSAQTALRASRETGEAMFRMNRRAPAF